MRDPYSLTDDELKLYARVHLQYEVDMLTMTTGMLLALARQTAKQSPAHWLVRNALLNTFAIHSRNLIDFLYLGPKKSRPTDVILEDYLDEESLNLPRVLPTLLQDAVRKASKQAAHLTRDRIEYETAGKEWKFLEIAMAILLALAKIAPRIPDSRVDAALRNKLSRLPIVIPPAQISLEDFYGDQPRSICLSLGLDPSMQTKTVGDTVFIEMRRVILQWSEWYEWSRFELDARSGPNAVMLPNTPGVYEAKLREAADRLTIGRASNLRMRVKQGLVKDKVPHSAGKDIRKNEDTSRIVIRWAVCDRPAAAEEELHRRHKSEFGRLPKYTDRT